MRLVHVQALVAETMRADIGGDLHKVEIGGPIAEGVGTAKGKDCEREGVVDGHVARHACEETGTARQREGRQHEEKNDRGGEEKIKRKDCLESTCWTYFSNAYTVVTSSAATRGQLSVAHVSLVPPAVTLSLPGQYEAAANCSKSWRFANVVASIAV